MMTSSDDGPDVLPKLPKCIASIHKLARGLRQCSLEDQIEIYQDSVAFLCYLKEDVARARHVGNVSELKAVDAVIHNLPLQESLIIILAGKESVDGVASESILPQVQNEGNSVKKRSATVDSESVPIKRQKNSQSVTGPSLGIARQTSFNTLSKGLDLFNTQLFAAVVLFASFRFVDQWPSLFVEAFAEDLFGARSWVDDERCSEFVSNIRLLLQNETNEIILPGTLEQATVLSSTFEKGISGIDLSSKSLEHNHTANETISKKEKRQPKTIEEKFSSDESDSGDEEVVELFSSSVRNLPPAKSAKINEPKNVEASLALSKSGDEKVMEEIKVREINGNDGNSEGMQKVAETKNITSTFDVGTKIQTIVEGNLPMKRIYAVNLQSISHIRKRYIGPNRSLSLKLIEGALLKRLQSQTKQSNTKLLSCLPNFLQALPRVRLIVAQNLEAWLHSPALADLARTLFTNLVESLENTDPPLPEDLNVISLVLSFKVKSIQLKRIMRIAERIPTFGVAVHMILYLFQGELNDIMDQPLLSKGHISEKQRMLASIYTALPRIIASRALVSVIMKVSLSKKFPRVLVIDLFRNLSNFIGTNFDGLSMVQEIIAFSQQHGLDECSLTFSYDLAARLILESFLTMAPLNDESSNFITPEQSESFQSTLMSGKKMALNWLVGTYAKGVIPVVVRVENDQVDALSNDDVELQGKLKKRNFEEKAVVKSPARNFQSVLSGNRLFSTFHDSDTILQRFCTTIERVLFLSCAPDLRDFLCSNSETSTDLATASKGIYERLDMCMSCQSMLDDEMIQMILNSALSHENRLTSSVALGLIEALVGKHAGTVGGLQIKDCATIFKLYDLTIYNPPVEVAEKISYPGDWWRVTILNLIFCTYCDAIKTTIWNEHPTLKAIIKMITSGRFRFPTIDCDEHYHELMKQDETAIRNKEAKLAASLFLPLVSNQKRLSIASQTVRESQGKRLSARQRAQREKALAKQRERKEAEARAESEKMERLLGEANRSIMLFDPRCPARKPPKEAVALILSASEKFALNKQLRQNLSPDFLLLTIGDSSRKSIERAYDWFLPIIASCPEIINRLHSSAACFLLLKHHEHNSTEKNGIKRSSLDDLALPLLEHVRGCLSGDLGETEACLAADLLMKEMSSRAFDKRQCARSVFGQALLQSTEKKHEPVSSWLSALLDTKYATKVVPIAIKFLSDALDVERGNILRWYLVFLQKYAAFLARNGIENEFDLVSTVCRLVSKRATVMTSVINVYSDLREMVLASIKTEFTDRLYHASTSREKECESITFYFGEDRNSTEIPNALLKTAISLISFWKEKSGHEEPSDEVISFLVDLLIGGIPNSQKEDRGAAGAVFSGSKRKAVSVDQWVMLVKAQCAFIAKKAAYSAPISCLPRLCLCCGLHSSSFLTILERLDRLGSLSEDRDRAFLDTISSSTAYSSNRRSLLTKLLGRIQAYSRIFEVDIRKNLFLCWLEAKVSSFREPSQKKKKDNCTLHDLNVEEMNDQLTSIFRGHGHVIGESTEWTNNNDENQLLSTSIQSEKGFSVTNVDEITKVAESLEDASKSKNLKNFQNCLRQLDLFLVPYILDIGTGTRQTEVLICSAASKILKCCTQASDFVKRANFLSILNMLPTVTRFYGDPELWKVIFSSSEEGGSFCQHTRLIFLCTCTDNWCQSHLRKCQTWLLEEWNRAHNGLCPSLSLAFFDRTSLANDKQDDEMLTFFVESFEKASAFITLIICCAKSDSILLSDRDNNDLPSWFTFLAIFCKSNKQCCKLAMERLDNENSRNCSSSIFRLYTMLPYSLPLDNIPMKQRLLALASEHREEWRSWQCSLDEQVIEMLRNLDKNGLQALTNLSKLHPLVVVRHFPRVVEILETDGTALSRGSCKEKRGRIHAESTLHGTLINQNLLTKIKIRHWGYDFTESVWISILALISAMPKEVVWSHVALIMGVTDILNQYLKLISGQSLLAQEKNIIRIKAQLQPLLLSFKTLNEHGWDVWCSSFIDDIKSRVSLFHQNLATLHTKNAAFWTKFLHTNRLFFPMSLELVTETSVIRKSFEKIGMPSAIRQKLNFISLPVRAMATENISNQKVS